MSDPQPTQSWNSTLVDLACLACFVVLVVCKVNETGPWTVLSSILGARLGMGAGKLIERAKRNDGGGGNSDRPGPPRSGDG